MIPRLRDASSLPCEVSFYNGREATTNQSINFTTRHPEHDGTLALIQDSCSSRYRPLDLDV
ncbi:MAG: hypothetical protein O2805_05560 [Proteobacteria bacterium]|nr:hypothetical protein [Pseudomonadota bacterium]